MVTSLLGGYTSMEAIFRLKFSVCPEAAAALEQAGLEDFLRTLVSFRVDDGHLVIRALESLDAAEATLEYRLPIPADEGLAGLIEGGYQNQVTNVLRMEALFDMRAHFHHAPAGEKPGPYLNTGAADDFKNLVGGGLHLARGALLTHVNLGSNSFRLPVLAFAQARADEVVRKLVTEEYEVAMAVAFKDTLAFCGSEPHPAAEAMMTNLHHYMGKYSTRHQSKVKKELVSTASKLSAGFYATKALTTLFQPVAEQHLKKHTSKSQLFNYHTQILDDNVRLDRLGLPLQDRVPEPTTFRHKLLSFIASVMDGALNMMWQWECRPECEGAHHTDVCKTNKAACARCSVGINLINFATSQDGEDLAKHAQQANVHDPYYTLMGHHLLCYNVVDSGVALADYDAYWGEGEWEDWVGGPWPTLALNFDDANL